MEPGKFSAERKKELIESFVECLKKFVLPENNEVEFEIPRPVVNDLKRTAIEGMGMHVYCKPGPEVFMKVHIILREEKGVSDER